MYIAICRYQFSLYLRLTWASVVPAVCSATDLAYYSSPYTASTSSASDVVAPSCGYRSAGAKDMVFTYSVPPGATIRFNQTSNDYDSVHELRYGSVCPGSNYVTCVDDPDLTPVSWTNTGSSAQPVYYVQSGYYTNEGSFTLTWEIEYPGESAHTPFPFSISRLVGAILL
jgi:hypothetical protein